MRASGTRRAAIQLFASLLFFGVLVAVVLFADEPFFRQISGAVAFLLGIPFVVLSIGGYGRALKLAHSGDYRATPAVRFLSHARAAGGAICMATFAFTLTVNFPALFDGSSDLPFLQRLWYVVVAFFAVVVGLGMVVTAYSKESNDESDTNDT